MRCQFADRRMEYTLGRLVAEHGIGDIAAVNVGKTEMTARRRCMILLVRREIIPEPVSAVVCKPQFPGLRVPVKPHRISHALGEHLEA